MARKAKVMGKILSKQLMKRYIIKRFLSCKLSNTVKDVRRFPESRKEYF